MTSTDRLVAIHADNTLPARVVTAINTLITAGIINKAEGADLASEITRATTAEGTKLAKSANLSDLANAVIARTNLGLGTAAIVNTGTASGNVPVLGTGGVLPIARIATGTADGTKFVRDDGTLATIGGNETLIATGAGIDPTGATDSTTALQAKIDAAAAAGLGIYIPAGTYKLSAMLRASTADARIAGAGVGKTVLAFTSGSTFHGLVVGPNLAFTGGGQGTGLDRPAGYVRDLSITGPTRAVDANVYAGLLMAGAPYEATRVYVTGFGVGFDLTANCYGAQFNHCFTNFGEVNVGLRLRRGDLSGQDLTFINCWFRGRFAGVHMDPFSAGYTILGGQIGAGYGLAADRTDFGCVTSGKDLELMLLGTRSTGGPADVGTVRNVMLKSVNFEGMHRVNVLRTYEPQNGWAVEGCHFIPSSNANDQSDAPLAVWKSTGAWNSSVAFRDCVVGGSTNNRFKGSSGKLIDVDTYTGAWPRISEENTQGFWSLIGDTAERLAHDQLLMEQAGVLHYQGGQIVGTGTPEGNVFARVGTTFRRLDGGASTTFYVKQTGTASTNTGWTALGASAGGGGTTPLLATGGTAPTATAGAQTGTTPPPVTVTGNNTRGLIQFGTGTGSPGFGRVVDLTFSGTYTTAPVVVLTPANGGTADVGLYLNTTSTTGFTVNVSKALTASQNQYNYAFNYHVIG